MKTAVREAFRMPRRYPFPHLYNARDLGGYASARGGETQWKRFIRCDSTQNLAPDEVRALLDLGVTDVVDLRGEIETATAPSALRAAPGIRYVNIPLSVDPASAGIAAEEARTGEFYLLTAENASAIRAILAAVAGAEGIALFHCTAGKDRTGIIAAVLLLLAGVCREDVVADYMVSEWYIRPRMEAVRKSYPDMPAHFARSRAAYMEDFLERLLGKYASVEGYLSTMGVDAETIARLRAKLLG